MLDIFNKNENKENASSVNDFIKITALLIHAAKIDENYTDNEKMIIINFLKSIGVKKNIEEIVNKAELEEQNSNQILKFTQEIKKKYFRI